MEWLLRSGEKLEGHRSLYGCEEWKRGEEVNQELEITRRR
jgi:hypothetical protein